MFLSNSRAPTLPEATLRRPSPMSEPTDNTSAKKRRVIHWDTDQGPETNRRKWTPLRILAWAAGGLVGLLLAAGLVIRGVRLVIGEDKFRAAQIAMTGDAAAASESFVSQSKAELARDTALKAKTELRKLPTDHPAQLQKLIGIEKSFLDGDTLLKARSYAKAFSHFTALNKEIDDFALEVKLKQETQKAYDEVLVRIRNLEPSRNLVGADLDKAFADAGLGRQLYEAGSFALAKQQYTAAFGALDRADLALRNYIADNIRKGQEAVTAGQREAALAAFRAALEKEPGNETALQGLKRAEVADRVHALLRQAEALEARKQFTEAAKTYASAFELDAFSATAQQGKARAERLAVETEFQGALDAATAAREARDWSKAIAEYERALKVFPKKDDVKKLLADVRKTAHDEAVKAALAKAYDHENKYEWELARAAYHDTLQLEKDHPDAKEGYVRTGRMIRTLLQFDKLIELAEQKRQAAEFQPAIRAFNEAMAIKPAHLPLTARVEQLRADLMAQSQPVSVTFRSDGETWVSISNFRMLGKLKEETLKILPGDYEVVGRRKGYQDVLLLLQVRNGSTPPVVNVVCTLRANS